MKCIKCLKEIPARRKFCSKSCSISYSNSLRFHSEHTKRKISTSVRSTTEQLGHPRRGKSNNKFSRVSFYPCTVCGKVFLHRSWTRMRKTCSRRCSTDACVKTRTYQNGSRKTTWFYNPWQGDVLLESSWEVRIAAKLTLLGIEWYRPKSITWMDTEGRPHEHYPDFYVPLGPVFLDPKNPYCLSRDQHKIQQVLKTTPLIYGDVEMISSYIDGMVSWHNKWT